MKENQNSVPSEDTGLEAIFSPNGQIGLKLKELYGIIQQEPIPARFVELLEKLDAAERAYQQCEDKLARGNE